MARLLKNYFNLLVPRFYMGDGGEAPSAPDPETVARWQLWANQQQSAFDAKQNRYTQNNPLGQVSWINKGTDKNPRWEQNTTLSPEQQKLFDTQMGTQNNLATQASDYANRLKGTLSGDVMGGDLATRNHVEQALIDRLNPYLEQDRQALATQLANQGLTYGGEAYGRAMMDQSRRTNDARLAAIAQAGNEMSRSQQLDINRRNQGINELSSLMQGSGNAQIPTYGGGTTVAGGAAPNMAQLFDNQFQAQLSNYNAKQAGKNSALSSGVGAAATIGGAFLSDERLKQNIKRVGNKNGHPWYEFEYRQEPGKRYRGVMAQDVAKTNPEAVLINDDGFMMVDYGLLGLEMESI